MDSHITWPYQLADHYSSSTWVNNKIRITISEFIEIYTYITVRGLTRGRMLISEFCTA